MCGKKDKLARIIYGYDIDDTEGWAIEIFVPELDDWDRECFFSFTKSAEHPEDGNVYIHIGFVNTLRRLMREGYTIQSSIYDMI